MVAAKHKIEPLVMTSNHRLKGKREGEREKCLKIHNKTRNFFSLRLAPKSKIFNENQVMTDLSFAETKITTMPECEVMCTIENAAQCNNV